MEQLTLWEGVLSKPRILKRETREIEVDVKVYVNRPIPPLGFILIKKWKTRKDDAGTVRLCPQCNEFGIMWGGGGWTDPKAEAAFEHGEKKGIRLSGAADRRISYQGVPILMHWSRYGEGICLWCGIEYWHDFCSCSFGIDGKWQGSSEWNTYYRPGLFGAYDGATGRVLAHRPENRKKMQKAARDAVRGRRRKPRHLLRSLASRTGRAG
jgi:hypothetical protein